ncbi:MAG: gamma-glutamyltransferase [Saprospiraceae bacterium]|nr:gamma-glutamyltransferase [Saprospiraceae bacterium]
MRLLWIGIFSFLFFQACVTSPEPLPYTVDQVLTDDTAMVVTAHPLASEVGIEILKKGGNAIDAAIATQFALAVVYPRAGNIGGGGFMVIRLANGQTDVLDYREKAPTKAHRDMYLDTTGQVIDSLSTYGGLAVGIPGTVAGMWAVHEKYGSLPWATLLEPSIALAKDGFPILQAEAERFETFKKFFVRYNGTKDNPFVKNTTWKEGDWLKQPKLAATLANISLNGPDGFYKGKVAKDIADKVQATGGILTADDLEKYQPAWRTPITGDYKEYHIISMPPASSGGVALLQMLKMVEPYPLKDWGVRDAKTVHTMVESMRRAFADRATHLGDSDFYEVPIDKLLDSTYLAEKMSNFNLEHATPSDSTRSVPFELKVESFETTHTSIIDGQGNAVSVTTTLNLNFGSKVLVNGAGFFLNNEMDDFSAKPGVPNYFGMVGNEINAIQPGKRMLSSMTPTIIEKDGKLWMVLGTPGGSTIMTSLFQVFLNTAEFDMDLNEAVTFPRFHHQWLPDEIKHEATALDAVLLHQLESMGHHIGDVSKIAKVKAIIVNSDGTLTGVGDPRVVEDDAEGF